MFWKPYFLFSQGLHKSVSIYWRGMAIYYLLFAIYAAAAVWLSLTFISSHASSLLLLVAYGMLTFIPLLTAYFLTLFTLTRGMQYFVARKPSAYRLLKPLVMGKNK
jgi:hypothetical protein